MPRFYKLPLLKKISSRNLPNWVQLQQTMQHPHTPKEVWVCYYLVSSSFIGKSLEERRYASSSSSQHGHQQQCHITVGGWLKSKMCSQAVVDAHPNIAILLPHKHNWATLVRFTHLLPH